MWLLPRTYNAQDVPCFQHVSATNIVTYIWLDVNEHIWKIVQGRHSHGCDELLASLPYAGELPASVDMWYLEPVLGNGGALYVHKWTLPQYKAKCQDASIEPKFMQLYELILDLKASMQHVEEKLIMWTDERDMMYDSVKNMTEMVVRLMKRQDAVDDEVKALRDLTEGYYNETSHPPIKKAKLCLCDVRS